MTFIDWGEYAHSLGVPTYHVREKGTLDSYIKKAIKLQETCLIWVHTPEIDDILNNIIPVEWL